MRFLVDNALSADIALGLTQLGHDAVHVRDYGMQASPDEAIFERAATENRILVSADTDFAALLATRQAIRPSLILFRRESSRNPRQQLALLQTNLPGLTDVLETGCVAVLEERRIRVRALPFSATEPG